MTPEVSAFAVYKFRCPHCNEVQIVPLTKRDVSIFTRYKKIQCSDCENHIRVIVDL